MSIPTKKWAIIFLSDKKLCTNLHCLGFNLTNYSFFPKILTVILVAIWTLLLYGTIRFPSPNFFSTWYLINNALLPLSTSSNLYWLCSSICIIKHFVVLFDKKFFVSAICLVWLLGQHRILCTSQWKQFRDFLFLCYIYCCCFCKSYYRLCWIFFFHFLQSWVCPLFGWNCFVVVP